MKIREPGGRNLQGRDRSMRIPPTVPQDEKEGRRRRARGQGGIRTVRSEAAMARPASGPARDEVLPLPPPPPLSPSLGSEGKEEGKC